MRLGMNLETTFWLLKSHWIQAKVYILIFSYSHVYIMYTSCASYITYLKSCGLVTITTCWLGDTPTTTVDGNMLLRQPLYCCHFVPVVWIHVTDNYTSIETRLWRASLLRRSHDSAPPMALPRRRSSNGTPTTALLQRHCYISVTNNGASNEQWNWQCRKVFVTLDVTVRQCMQTGQKMCKGSKGHVHAYHSNVGKKSMWLVSYIGK